MGKKDQHKERARTTATPELKHSPFASLALPSAPSAEAAETARSGRNASPQTTPPPTAATDRDEVTAKARGRLVLRRETKHRAGKAVVVVAGFAALPETSAALEDLTRELKQLLGCGGTLTREREIVLQSDNPSKIAEQLRAKGYRVVGVGS